jgi:hypothetical protein
MWNIFYHIILSRFFISNLIYRSNNITASYNDEDFNKVVYAAKEGENELLAVMSSGVSINITNMVNHNIKIAENLN